jgi:hypothetical protein
MIKPSEFLRGEQGREPAAYTKQENALSAKKFLRVTHNKINLSQREDWG